MANKPLSMIKIRQVLLFLERGASQRKKFEFLEEQLQGIC